jgi:prolyl-tRNA editing enzyme YbaK/EbsC (Cys-tRNA(Pro) deacylase)
LSAGGVAFPSPREAGRGEGRKNGQRPATVALVKAGVAFTLHDYDPNAERIGLQAAEALGVAPARLFKTLMAKAGDIVCVLAPADRAVSLKKLAAAAGANTPRCCRRRRPSA